MVISVISNHKDNNSIGITIIQDKLLVISMPQNHSNLTILLPLQIAKVITVKDNSRNYSNRHLLAVVIQVASIPLIIILCLCHHNHRVHQQSAL